MRQCCRAQLMTSISTCPKVFMITSRVCNCITCGVTSTCNSYRPVYLNKPPGT